MSDEQTIEIKVGGMSCQHCVNAVDKAVRAVPGVTDAAVDLANGSVKVSGAFDRQEIVQAIKAAGYEAA
jgi:copper ion binding protein